MKTAGLDGFGVLKLKYPPMKVLSETDKKSTGRLSSRFHWILDAPEIELSTVEKEIWLGTSSHILIVHPFGSVFALLFTGSGLCFRDWNAHAGGLAG